jgi:hypothetical protein
LRSHQVSRPEAKNVTHSKREIKNGEKNDEAAEEKRG